VPNQFVFTAAGRVHDLKAATALKFCAGWTYSGFHLSVQDK
jgi:hypothetical protein